MKNDTLCMLERIAYQYQREKLKKEPGYQALAQHQTALQEAFLNAHQDDHALILKVNDMLDAQNLLAECQNEFTFYLGLQIGLELGGLDILRGI